MELMEALRTRRAIRGFSAETVEKGAIEKLVDDAAILAPSAVHFVALALCAERNAFVR